MKKTLNRLARPAAAALIVVAAAGLALAVLWAKPGTRMERFPGVMLWAWERPEDLRFLDPRQAGVAFLAKTIFIRHSGVEVRPRLQPLRVPAGTRLMAVARIESADPFARPAEKHRAAVVAAIAEMAGWPGVYGVQVDFDARASERGFYRDLLVDLRQALADSTALSITALASWCLDDNWLEGLPIDEAVPMLFQMGPDGNYVRRHLAGKGDFIAPACRSRLGLAAGGSLRGVSRAELRGLPAGRRIYLFPTRAWTGREVRAATRGVKPWP